MMEPVEPEPHAPTVRFFRTWNATARGHIIAMISEFVGTMMFLFFSYAAAQIGNEKVDTLRPVLVQPGPSLLQITYIAGVFGVSLGVNVWIFYRVSGGMFNPAVRHLIHPGALYCHPLITEFRYRLRCGLPEPLIGFVWSA